MVTHDKLIQHDTWFRLHEYDIISITETGVTTPSILQQHFPTHTVFDMPGTAHGQAGSGIAVLVSARLAQHTCIEAKDPEVSCLWLRIKAAGTHLSKDMFLATCYIPPEGSSQLRKCPLEYRYQRLLQHSATMSGYGHVMLCGDFNARIADLEDLTCPPPTAVRPQLRCCQDGAVNRAGRLFIEACQANGLAVLTGRTAGDTEGVHTYHHTSGSSRPDHVAVDAQLFPLITHHSVLPHKFGSDHHPICTTISLAAPPTPPTPPTTHPLPARWMWDPGCQEQVFARLSDPHTQAAMQAALELLPVNLQQAYDDLAGIFVSCAREGGLRARLPGTRSRSRRGDHPQKPWFDTACKEARKKLRQARRDNTSHVAALEHDFHRLCRTKKRAYKKASALEYARLVKSNPNRLWEALRPPATTPATCPADPHQCRPYFQAVLNPPSDPNRPQPPTPPELGDPTAEPAHPLNGDITADDVLRALKQLKNNKSPGMDGLPPELLKYACPRQRHTPIFSMNPLLQPLATFFTHLMSNGTAPESWAATLVTAIFKKGDPSQWSNYRPVAMVPLLAKVYAIILNNRLVSWAEAAGVRVPAQTGFRPRHATTHHAFVLQHLIDKYKRRGKRLYCCFVDLAKAYDSVPRDLLWQRLHDVGVRGRMLHAIKGLYEVGVDMHIKTANGTLDPVHTSVGVKQGCPLSPTLFGLYIDGLQHHVAADCPGVGPVLNNAPDVRLNLLIYADDTAILANSAAELQRLVTSVDDWCCTHGMTISVVKSEVVVFNCSSPAADVSVQGKRLPVSKVFKYLGVWFHCQKGAAHNVHKAAARGKFAIACLHRKMSELDVGSNVNLSLNLYNSLVMPAMLYGCEVWGTCALGSTAPADSTVLPEQVHRNFVKFALKMRSKTKAWVAFREAGMYPLQYSCMHRMLAFLDSVLALDDGEYAKIAMLDCIADARSAGVSNWFSKLSKLLTHVHDGTPQADVLGPDGTVDVDNCLMLWRRYYHTSIWRNLHNDPRTAPSENVSLVTYHRWFASNLPEDDSHWRPAPCITADNIPCSQLISLLKLRTNSHHLNIERLRHTRPRVPRSRRACPWCHTPDSMHDELHCVFECPHLSHTRLQYPALPFGSDGRVQDADMRKVFTAENLVAPLASFVHSIPAIASEER